VKRRTTASAKRRTTTRVKKRPTMSAKKKTLVSSKKKTSPNMKKRAITSVKESGNKHEEKLEKKVGLELELEPLFILALRFFLGLAMAPMFFFPF
jgi:hypothetical protein